MSHFSRSYTMQHMQSSSDPSTPTILLVYVATSVSRLLDHFYLATCSIPCCTLWHEAPFCSASPFPFTRQKNPRFHKKKNIILFSLSPFSRRKFSRPIPRRPAHLPFPERMYNACMYTCMYTFSRRASTGYGCQSCLWSDVGKNEILPEKIPCPRSCLRIWSRETGLAAPSRVTPLVLHTQAECININSAYSRAMLLPPAFRDDVHLHVHLHIYIVKNRHWVSP